jgi:hypothetical protein
MSTHKMATAEEMYWAREGSRTAAFLLVIPGAALIGYGYGMMTGQQLPSAVIGFGAGMVIWGLVVALRKSERLS